MILGLAVLLGLVCWSLLTIFRPRRGFLLYLLLRPVIDNFDVLREAEVAGGFNALKLLGLALPLVLMINCYFRRAEFFKEPGANIFLAFLVAALPSVFMSVSWTKAFGYWLQLFTFWTVLIFFVRFFDTPERIGVALKTVMLSAIYPMLRLAMTLVSGERMLLDYGIQRNVGGYFQMAPIAGMLFTFFPAYLVGLRSAEHRRTKILLGLGLIMLFFFLYKTYYRSALLATVAFALMYLVMTKRFVLLGSLAIAVVGALACSSFLQQRFGEIPQLFEHLSYLTNPFIKDYDLMLSGRFAIWRTMLVELLYNCKIQNFLWGFGADVHIRDCLIVPHNFDIAPHNDYLGFLYQNGFVALMGFLIFGLAVLFKALKSPNVDYRAVFFAFFSGCAVMALTENYFGSVRNIVFLGVYVGILTVAARSRFAERPVQPERPRVYPLATGQGRMTHV